MLVCYCVPIAPRLAISLILASKLDELVAAFAVVCSTWTPVNQGTSKRSFLCPLGDQNVAAVRRGNKMMSRLDECQNIITLACIFGVGGGYFCVLIVQVNTFDGPRPVCWWTLHPGKSSELLNRST